MKKKTYLQEEFKETNQASSEYIPKGKLLQNPYEIHTFRSAFQNVLDSLKGGSIKTGKGYTAKSDLDSTAIAPNYLYLRFNPTDSIQETILKTHKEIIVIDYPFEYEEADDYRATLTVEEEEEILSYWCSVPITQKLPNIPYVVLQEMYLPEADPDYNDDLDTSSKTVRGKVNDKIDLMNHVIELAYSSTGNSNLLPEPPLEKEKGETCETCFLGINLRKRWTPTGKIEIWDNIVVGTTSRRVCETVTETDYSGCYTGNYANCPSYTTRQVCRTETTRGPGSYIPLEGANVLARDTWTIGSAITDSRGNFRMSRIRAKARFLIQWDRYEFSIRDHTGVFQAEGKGPKLYDRPWNHKIKGGREEYRGHIFRAAMHFYYHNIGGLTRPPTNSLLKTQMKIAAIENRGVSSHKPIARWLGVAPRIKIKRWGLSSERIYGVTIHELAHAQHWRVDQANYSATVFKAYVADYVVPLHLIFGDEENARRFLESWATGVEIYLTQMKYRTLGETNYEYRLLNENNEPNQINGINKGNLQTQVIDDGDDARFYTSAVFDMTDNFNQATDFGLPNNIKDTPVDNVSTYTMPELESALKGVKSWTQYRDKIINLYGKEVDDVRELFNNW